MSEQPPEDQQASERPGRGGARRWIISTTLIVAFLAGGTVVASLLSRFKEEPARRESIAVLPVVRTQILQPEDVTEQFVGYGSVRPIQQATISAEVAGRIVTLPDELRAGQSVSDGETLLTIDDREYKRLKERALAYLRADEAALDELKIESEKLDEVMATARREVALTEAEWKRVSALYDRDLAAKKEFDFANLAWKQATRVLQGYEMQASRIQPRSQQLLASIAARKADAESAQLNIDRCTVNAPFDAVIKERRVDKGNRVAPGMPLFDLINNRVVEIPAQLPASVYGKVKVNAACEVQSESLPDTVWVGRVARIAPDVDRRTRTFAAYIEIDNREHDRPCVPGTFTKITVGGPRHQNALLIPRGAINEGRIFVFDAGQAHERVISVDFMLNEQAGVSGDVQPGDRIILPPISALDDKMAVKASETGGTEVDRANNNHVAGVPDSTPEP